MQQGIFHKRIPTVLALFILIAGLLITGALVQQGVFTTTRATPNEEPQNIQITNITNKSFTVVFTTLDPTIAAVTVENANLQKVIYDIRNPEGNQAFVSHFITISDLTPQTPYSFTILSNGKAYQENGKNFIATTAGGDLSPLPSPYSLSGTILQPDGSPGDDVLVQATIPNAAGVSAITDSNGNYTIPTELIRNLSHDQIITLVPNTQIDLSAIRGNVSSKVSYQYQPGTKIPTISLSQNYSFIAGQEEKTTATGSSLLAIPTGTKKSPQIKITTPKTDQTFTDSRPQFKGTALPNTLVTLTIRSDPLSVQVRTDPNGNWAYRPAVTLSPGAHTITVQAPDINGVLKTATSSFTVFASGSQIAESATPSATPKLTPTATPTLAPTAMPALSPSPTILVPTPTGVSTPTPTLIPSTSPLPTPTVMAVTPTTLTPPPNLPPTGNTTASIFLTTLSILFIVSGSALLFLL